jgi:hypothetical protein
MNGFGSPGVTSRNRVLAQMLAQRAPGLNNGSHLGGLASALQQGLASYLIGRDGRDETAASRAMAQGMSAKPWTPPDENVAMGPSGTPQGDMTMTRAQAMERAAPAGGYEGALSALSGMGGNEYAGRLTQQLLSAKLGRDQQLRDRTDQRAYEGGVRKDERDYQTHRDETKAERDAREWRERFGMQNAAERANFDYKQAHTRQAPESFSGPTEVIDPATGQRVLVQMGNRGSVRPVEGYGAAPPDPKYGSDRPYPEDVYKQKVDIAKAQGEAAASARPLTEAETKAGGFAVRMEKSATDMQAAIAGPDGKPGTADDYDPTKGAGAFANALLPTGVSNFFQTPSGQKYYQAASNWVRANLRKESGAVIGDQEMADEVRNYFPMPNDSPEVVQQKAEVRAVAEAAMKTAAGKAYGDVKGRLKTDPNSGWSIKRVE